MYSITDMLRHGLLEILLAIFLCLYLLESWLFYRLSRKYGLKCSIFAFFPLGELYNLGRIADQLREINGKKPKMKLLGVIYFVGAGGAMIPLVSMYFKVLDGPNTQPAIELLVILYLGATVFYLSFLIWLYRCIFAIYKDHVPNRAAVLLVVSMIFILFMLICLFIFSKESCPRRSNNTRFYNSPAPYIPYDYGQGQQNPASTYDYAQPISQFSGFRQGYNNVPDLYHRQSGSFEKSSWEIPFAPEADSNGNYTVKTESFSEFKQLEQSNDRLETLSRYIESSLKR